MNALVYWMAAIGYLLGAGLLGAIPSVRGRWYWLAGLVGAGAATLMPVSCRSLILLICVPGTSDCDSSQDTCSTPIGLRLPYTDAIGITAAQAVGIGLLLAGVLIAALAVGKRRRALGAERAGHAVGDAA